MKTFALGFLLLIGAMGVTGCVGPSITKEGARVVASEAPPPPSCTPLGDVSGRAGGDVSGAVADSAAIVGFALNDARNSAGKLGGDYLYVGKPQLGVTMGKPRSASFGGRAYRCAKESRPTD